MTIQLMKNSEPLLASTIIKKLICSKKGKIIQGLCKVLDGNYHLCYSLQSV